MQAAPVENATKRSWMRLVLSNQAAIDTEIPCNRRAPRYRMYLIYPTPTAEEIHEELEAAERMEQIADLNRAESTMHRYRAGALLNRVKPTIPHGKWRRYMQENFPKWAVRTLEDFMDIAELSEKEARSSAHLGVAGLIRIVREKRHREEWERRRNEALTADIVADDFVQLVGDARDRMDALDPGTHYACITSPPYWRLRIYPGPPMTFGDDPCCEHEWETKQDKPFFNKCGQNSTRRSWAYGSHLTEDEMTVEVSKCPKCGAWRGPLGWEETPHLYAQHLVEIFSKVRRVLRADGTLFLNLGTTYLDRQEIDIPSIVAEAHVNDGWIRRATFIWDKSQSFRPENGSEKRPSRAHEYIIMFAKGRDYYYDRQASGIKHSILTVPGERNRNSNHPAPFPRALVRAFNSREFPGRRKTHRSVRRHWNTGGRSGFPRAYS